MSDCSCEKQDGYGNCCAKKIAERRVHFLQKTVEARNAALSNLDAQCAKAEMEVLRLEAALSTRSKEHFQHLEEKMHLKDALWAIQAEIDRGVKRDRCLGCCDGNDIPEGQLCRCCWRIWEGGKMYLLWDWQETQKRISHALLSTQ